MNKYLPYVSEPFRLKGLSANVRRVSINHCHPYTARFSELKWTDSTWRSISADVQSLEYTNDELLFWELYGFMQLVYHRRKTIEVSKIVRSDWELD